MHLQWPALRLSPRWGSRLWASGCAFPRRTLPAKHLPTSRSAEEAWVGSLQGLIRREDWGRPWKAPRQRSAAMRFLLPTRAHRSIKKHEKSSGTSRGVDQLPKRLAFEVVWGTWGAPYRSEWKRAPIIKTAATDAVVGGAPSILSASQDGRRMHQWQCREATNRLLLATFERLCVPENLCW